MNTEQGWLTYYLVTDLSGITRGRAHWDTSEELKAGVGWVPVNSLITSFDTIPSPNPWGAFGDVRLVGDSQTLTDVRLQAGRRLRFLLSDICTLDGPSFELCARSFAKKMIDELASEGYTLLASFEQEFWLSRHGLEEPTPGFSFQRAVHEEPFGSRLMGLLEHAGLEPEMLLPEFAPNQFEFTMKPSAGIMSADRAVISRELIRAASHDDKARASFAPIRVPGGIGSGVHVHLSLRDKLDKPVMYDPRGDGGLSKIGGAFCAGIAKAMSALVGITAPSVVSYQRLRPHHWSAAYTCVGDRNREATLRICPINRNSDTPIQEQFNIEYRAADATANPYLVLGCLIAAGLDGLRSGLDGPTLLQVDPSEKDEGELASLGIKRLPNNLSDALLELSGYVPLMRALGKPLLEAFLMTKEAEIAACKDLSEADVCAHYCKIY